MSIVYNAIGIIHTPFTELEQMPIQPTGEASAGGHIEIYPDFVAGLKDLDGFSHLILLYHLHKAADPELVVIPFLDTEAHGVFATRAPVRPNPLGLSVVRLTGIRGNILHFAALDILDGTPLLDIKPYIPEFDAPGGVRIGWLETVRGGVRSIRSDDRFS